ncbi:MAG: hypothetical protein ACYC54_14370 [Sedimentisphaerales bacterium]
MKSYNDVAKNLSGLQDALCAACDWLINISQVKTDIISSSINKRGLLHENWRGAFRGEYTVATQSWHFFCPVWHGGQAIKALTLAYKLTGKKDYLDSALLGGNFILNQQIKKGHDKGLILAYEDALDKVNVSAVLECLDGLFVLAQCTGETKYRDAALDALTWCKDRSWIKGQGLILDLYDQNKCSFIDQPYPAKNNAPGRPLADDAVWLKGYQLTKNKEFRDAFYEILQRLLQDEYPHGNWICYPPANHHKGLIHPRHAYWWGLPMIYAWRDTKEHKWLDAAIRSGKWYINAQRADGGFFRETALDFKTSSFGHATSGVMCAVIMWLELFDETQDTCWLEPIYKALRFAIEVQFRQPKDANLKGCILEKVLPPDGTDASPYYIRDLGTIFFVMAASMFLNRCQQGHNNISANSSHRKITPHDLSPLNIPS